jgi:hypothetical protein
MRNYVGLDVSLKTTSICILDEKGKRLIEGEVDSTPEAVGEFLKKSKLEIEQNWQRSSIKRIKMMPEASLKL